MIKSNFKKYTLEADVDDYGTWSVSAVLGGGGSATDTLSIDAVKVYTLELVIIPDADHGLAFPVDMNAYIAEAKAFFEQIKK